MLERHGYKNGFDAINPEFNSDIQVYSLAAWSDYECNF